MLLGMELDEHAQIAADIDKEIEELKAAIDKGDRPLEDHQKLRSLIGKRYIHDANKPENV
jgi:hypothetical protein